MNKEEPYRDQAEKLKQRIEKYQEPDFEGTGSLPPRSAVHNKKKKRTKVKPKFTLIRLLVLFFILLPITIFGIYTYIGNKHIGIEKTSVPAKGYETINFEKSNHIPTNPKKNHTVPKNTVKGNDSSKGQQ